MKEQLHSYEEHLDNDPLKVAIVCLYGYPHKYDTEPFAGQVLKASLDKRFADSVSTNIYLLGHEKVENANINALADELVNNENSQIIALSIPQGTQEIAEAFLSRLKEINYDQLTILGHALPTYLPDKFINLFPNTLIVRGWGEESLSAIVEKKLNNSNEYDDIPNLIYLKNGEFVANNIKWPETFGLTSERFLDKFFPRVEASRGCHHDTCTFCTRPLRNKGQAPWVRISPEIVLQNIEAIRKSGGNKFTFTDEDFFGNDLEGALQIAEGIRDIGNLSFSLDLRVDSIINPSDSDEKALQRDELLRKLKDAGLSFIFIGAETFSKSQLKRYGKGVSPEKGIASIQKIANLSIPMELGLITFDPILTLDELSENVAVLEKSGIWRYCAQLFNELNVFEGNPYSVILKRLQLDTGFNSDYMTYSYKYLHPDVEEIRNVCRPLKKEVDPVYTSARNIFRTKFSLPEFVEEYVLNYRKRELTLLQELIQYSGGYLSIYTRAREVELQHVKELKANLFEYSYDNNLEYSELINNIDQYINQFNNTTDN